MSRYLPKIKRPVNVNEMIDGDRNSSKMKETTGFTFVNRTGEKLIRGVSVRCLDSF
jgi:hypothetical protein